MGATRTVVRGLAALAVLALLTIGLPWLLLRISGSPIPDTIPTWDQIWTALTSRDDGTLLLSLLKYAAWAGWALFAASLTADLVARVRGISVPRLGPQQQLASGLVSAVAAIAVMIPAAAPATARAPAPGPSQTISTTVAGDEHAAQQVVSWRSSLAGASAPPARPAAARGYRQTSRFTHYTVRTGDCLWDIAWNELGDPERWPELWESSRHLRQPGGHRITDPDHIEPGWTILIPTTRRSANPVPEPSHRPAPSSRTAPPVTTPLDTAAVAADRDGQGMPAVTTPLSLHSGQSNREVVESAQALALDRWDTAVNRADIPSADRGAWKTRISALRVQ